MIYIQHRVNTIKELQKTPPAYGVELDLRDDGGQLILHHDPFTGGENFEKYLSYYNHRFMIVNVKSEGVEEKALSLLKRSGVRDYFFLDLSFPALIRMVRSGEQNIAVRFSEYEPVEQALALQGKIRWVWVDCFSQCPLDKKAYEKLSKHFRLCLVSPELQKHPLEKITEWKKQLSGFKLDAVCTKDPEQWKK